MKDVCREVGMTYETLQFYCNQGLVPNVGRDVNNHRIFDDRDVAWLKCLICLKRCGMSLREMKVYMALCRQGPSTIVQRKAVLARRRQALLQSISELNGLRGLHRPQAAVLRRRARRPDGIYQQSLPSRR